MLLFKVQFEQGDGLFVFEGSKVRVVNAAREVLFQYVYNASVLATALGRITAVATAVLVATRGRGLLGWRVVLTYVATCGVKRMGIT